MAAFERVVDLSYGYFVLVADYPPSDAWDLQGAYIVSMDSSGCFDAIGPYDSVADAEEILRRADTVTKLDRLLDKLDQAFVVPE